MQQSLILGIVFMTGVAGLIYEVTWQRYIANLLGSHAKASAIVLAVFLGGLSVGYWLFGRLSKNKSNLFLVKAFGWCEVGIGIWAVLFTYLFEFIWQTYGLTDSTHSFATVMDLFIATLLIGLPSVLMGATLPLLTQGMALNTADTSAFHAKVYAINTAGAFLGCVMAGFFLIPELGLGQTLFVTCAINLFAGFAVIALAPALCNQRANIDELAPANGSMEQHPMPPRLSSAQAAVISVLAGTYSIALQTIFIRAVGLTLGSSEYAFSMVVSVYILLLAIGAWRMRHQDLSAATLFRNQIVLFFALVFVYFSIPFWGYIGHVIRVNFRDIDAAFYLFHLALFVMFLALLWVPLSAMGRTMPMIFSLTRTSRDHSGANVGHYYSLNTIGCVAGAIFGGYLSLYFINLDSLFTICLVLAAAAMTTSLTHFRDIRKPRVAAIILMTGIALGATAGNPWPKEWLAKGLFRLRHPTPFTYQGAATAILSYLGTSKVVAYKDDPNTTVAVLEQTQSDPSPAPRVEENKTPKKSRSIVVNGKSDGETSGPDLKTVLVAGHLGALLHSSSTGNVANIGFGTGISSGAFTAYDSVKTIDIFEISPAIKDFSTFFDFANHNVSTHPKVVWNVGDAYRLLGAKDKQYDVIVSEPSNPWVTGIEKLFALEFYQLVSRKIAPGGLYIQWFHLYDMSEKTASMVINTFSSEFKYVRFFQINKGDIVMVGSMSTITSDNLEARLTGNARARSDLELINLNSADSILGLEIPVHPMAFKGGGLHSLELPKLAYSAGKDFFKGQYFNLRSTLTSTTSKPWTNQAIRQMLFAQKLAKQTPRGETLSAAKDIACGPSPIETQVAEAAINFHCGMILGAYAVENHKVIKDFVEANDMAFLDYLREKSSTLPPSITTFEAAGQAISLYHQRSSPFLKLSGNRLIQILNQQCLSGTSDPELMCRLDLAIALASNGDPDKAESLTGDLTTSDDHQIKAKYATLAETIRQAKMANDSALR